MRRVNDSYEMNEKLGFSEVSIGATKQYNRG